MGLTQELSARIGLGQVENVKELISGFYTLSGNPGINIGRIAEELYAHGYPDEAREINDMAIAWYVSRPEGEFRTLRGEFFNVSYMSLFVLGDDDRSPSEPERENIIPEFRDRTRDARIEDLRRIINDLETENPDDLLTKMRKGLLAAQTGDRETAQKMYDWLENVDQPYMRGSNKWRQAMIAAAFGEKSRAVTLLQDAFRNGSGYNMNNHRYYPFFPLHGFPEFEEFIKPKK